MEHNLSPNFLGFLLMGLVLFLIGAVPVVGGGVLLRRWRQLSWGTSLAASHTLIVLLCVSLYPTEIFLPGIPFDDLYFSYFFVPGLHIYLPAAALANGCFPVLRAVLSNHQASICGIIFVPGFICLLLGTIQWFLIGTLFQFGLRRRNHG